MSDDKTFEHLESIALHGVHAVIMLAETLDLQGQLPRAWYPDIHPTRPRIQITLHADSFINATDEEVKARDWFIATAQHKDSKDDKEDIDLQVTAARQNQNMDWVVAVKPLEIEKIPDVFDLRRFYERSLHEDLEKVKTPNEPSAAALDLMLHKQLNRQMFVTVDRNTQLAALNPMQNRNLFVLNPLEARRYVDLYLKAFGAYRIRPNYTANRGAYYWLRLWNLVPAFQATWPYALFGRDNLRNSNEITDFMHNLYARIIGQMQASDQIGWLRYSPANNDTRDQMLNLLNYFIVLATGVFDSLA